MTAIVSSRIEILTASVFTDLDSSLVGDWFRIPPHSGLFFEFVSSAEAGAADITLRLQFMFKGYNSSIANFATSLPDVNITSNATSTLIPAGNAAQLPRGDRVRVVRSADNMGVSSSITLTVRAYWSWPGAHLTGPVA